MSVTTSPSPTTPRTVAPHAPHPGRAAPGAVVRHSLTLAWRSMAKLVRQPEQFIDLTLQPVIFLVMFVYLFGGAITGSTHAYLQYVLPGIVVQTVLFATMGTGIGLCEDMATGVFDRFRALPISRMAPLAGAVLGDVARFLVGITTTVVFGMVLGFRVHTNVLAALAAVGLVVVFASSLSWIAVLLGVQLKHSRSVQGVGFLVMFPLTFGSNMFVRTATMPGWLQAWVKVNPVTDVTAAVRGLLDGGPVAVHAAHSLLWSAGLWLVFAPLAVAAYRRKA